MKPFVGVDGEGGNNATGAHEYYLLRAGDAKLETGACLTAYECLDFLSSLSPKREYVAYFFDYDVTMICRGLPEERVARLLDRDSRITAAGQAKGWGPMPLDVGPFQIDYLPHKEFRVRRGYRGPWIIVQDVGSFFQGPFVRLNADGSLSGTLEKWQIGDAETRLRIAKGKAQRADFGALTSDVDEYNALEIVYLEELMTRFRDTCRSVGYMPRTWEGPGNIASAMLLKHGVPKAVDLYRVPDAVWQMAQAAYYGGRFETTAVGHVPGPVWQYDINSAYPDACRHLPCLEHGSWFMARSRVPGLFLAQVHFSHPAGTPLCSFPIRMDNGSIRFPREGRGWYWSYEIEAAERLGAKVRVETAWGFESRCDCRPFFWVHELYLARQALGKSDRGYVLKLALNSIYGKLAQSIGRAPWGNPVWASLITAMTRAKLIDATTQAPNNILMLATDGVFSTSRLNLPVGDGLGMWSEDHHPDMFIVQPGVYFAGQTTPKTRGVPLGKVLDKEQEFRQLWKDWRKRGSIPTLSLPLRNFISLRLAYARGKPHTAGQWVEAPKEISFDWSTKREGLRFDGHAYRTAPYTGSAELTTVPYDRNIGGLQVRDDDRLEWEDNPEWAEGWMLT